MGIQKYSHVGVTVSDLDTSRRFFVEGLGFAPVDDNGSPRTMSVSGDVGKKVANFLEVDDFAAEIAFVERDGQVLELVNYLTPEPERHPRRPMNVCGLTHLCFLVSDIDEVARRLEELGGEILEDTRISTDLPDGRPRTYMLSLAPDASVRVELIETDGLPNT
jgi:glyoxylase I family protein